MADRYVAKDGNDANPGTQALPKLTIGGAIAPGGFDANPAENFIHVGAGVYHETITNPHNVRLTITADGNYVVLDGLGVLANGAAFNSTNPFTGVPLRPIIGIIFRNFTSNIITTSGGAAFGWPTENCFLDGSAFNVVGVDQVANGRSPSHTNTVFYKCSVGVLNDNNNGSVQMFLERCTFFKCTDVGLKQGSLAAATTTGIQCRNCAFVADGPTQECVELGNVINQVFDFNNYDVRGGAPLGSIGGTPHASLSAWQAAFGGGNDANSHDFPSGFLSEDDAIFIPNLSLPSQLISAGQPTGFGGFKTIGAYDRGFGLLRTDPAWTGGSHFNTVFEPFNNRIRLAPAQTVGVFTTGTKTIVPSQVISQKRIAFLVMEANVVTPGSVETVDRLETDQVREIELAFNGGPFQPIAYGQNALFPGTFGQPDQIIVSSIRARITLRKNGNL